MKNSQEKRYISKTLKIGNLDDTPPMSIPLPVLISSLLVVIDWVIYETIQENG